MYEGDTPNAERRAAALALDRDLLRELLGQEELRELIDPVALDEVEADLQRLSERTQAANSDGLHDVLRALGDLTADEAAGPDASRGVGRARCSPSWSASGAPCACGSAARSAGSPPRTPASTATPWAPCPRAAFPTPSSRRWRSRWPAWPAATPAPTGPSPPGSWPPLRRGPGPVLRELERSGRWFRASCAREAASASGATPTCCAGCGAPRWPRSARRWSRPSSGRSPASSPPGRAWTPRPPPARASTACASCSCRSRAWPWLRRLGARRAPAAHRELLPGLARPALRGRRDRVGGRRLASAAAAGGWPCYFRDDARWLGPPPVKGDPPAEPLHETDPRAPGARRRLLDRPAGRPGGGRAAWSCRRRSGISCGPAR